ncbi:retrovirus-related pol polyprotein from transposon TNT 1-94 [Tanacetum coccineum]
MTRNRSQLVNFVSKFLGTGRFGNDHIARIIRYGDYQLGNVTISRVYYVEGLGHNLFSVGQFCDADLEVAFRKNTCFIRNLEGVDLLFGSRDTNLYTISLDDMLKTSPICLLSKASKTKSWLWHRRLSHLNFGTLNKLAKDGLARGIPRLKFQKDHLCSACTLGKSKKSSHQPKAEDTNQEKLYLFHMDLCGPMRVAKMKLLMPSSNALLGLKAFLMMLVLLLLISELMFLSYVSTAQELQRKILKKRDWENPEGGDYPFDLTKPLPLVMSGNHQKVPVDYFFNNDLKYLQGGVSTMTYTTSITKTKVTQYDLPGIEDMVLNIWVPVKVAYDKHELWGISR